MRGGKLLGALGAAILCAGRGAESGPIFWDDLAEPIQQIGGISISALAVADGRLYVAGTAAATLAKEAPLRTRLLMLDLKALRIEDATAKLASGPNDEITEILFDADRRQLWLITNHNALTPDRYDLQLHLERKYSDAKSIDRDHDPDMAFLAGRAKKIEEAESACIASSASLALDAAGAVVGCFKDDIFLYSFAQKRARRVYRPTSPDRSVIAAALARGTAFAGTSGDGLVLIDRVSTRAVRLPGRMAGNGTIGALAVDGDRLFIASERLYLSSVSNLRASVAAAARTRASPGIEAH